jgi:hypothetical protein
MSEHKNPLPDAQPPLGPTTGDSHMPVATATAGDSAFRLRIKPDRRSMVITMPPTLERRGPGA